MTTLPWRLSDWKVTMQKEDSPDPTTQEAHDPTTQEAHNPCCYCYFMNSHTIAADIWGSVRTTSDLFFFFSFLSQTHKVLGPYGEFRPTRFFYLSPKVEKSRTVKEKTNCFCLHCFVALEKRGCWALCKLSKRANSELHPWSPHPKCMVFDQREMLNAKHFAEHTLVFVQGLPKSLGPCLLKVLALL